MVSWQPVDHTARQKETAAAGSHHAADSISAIVGKIYGAYAAHCTVVLHISLRRDVSSCREDLRHLLVCVFSRGQSEHAWRRGKNQNILYTLIDGIMLSVEHGVTRTVIV